MNTLKNALHKIDNVLVMTDRALYGHSGADNPLFSIDQTTVNKITEFRKHYPDITQEFVDHEINATLCELVYELEREHNGDV